MNTPVTAPALQVVGTVYVLLPEALNADCGTKFDVLEVPLVVKL
jgi:hypothetical protein